MVEASTQGQNVTQPTAQDMVRYWQAAQMVNLGFYIHPVNRTISASLEVVQIRLSVVFTTGTIFVLAVALAALAHYQEPLDEHGQHMTLPKSPLAWIVEAARQNHGQTNYQSHRDFANERDDLFYSVSTARKGLSRTQITSNRDDLLAKPFLGHADPHIPFDSSGLSVPSPDHQGTPTNYYEGDFDPYSPYDKAGGESISMTDYTSPKLA
jgi:hypothetical protein